MGSTDALRQYLMTVNDQQLLEILEIYRQYRPKSATAQATKNEKWYDKQIYGLDEQGKAHLKELTDCERSDKKLIRYLKQLKAMRLEVPAFFRETISPKEMYKTLQIFCREHDIPEEILGKLVPILVNYIETGHMRPVLLIGEKGCGKTSSLRMLAEEALQLPMEIIKVPQTDRSHGLCGDCGIYQSADAGALGAARLRKNKLVMTYIFDEIDKCSHDRTRASVDDELLSITDETITTGSIYDNYLEVALSGLEYCPMFFTGNNLDQVNPILVDRCTVIHFPNGTPERIKSIMSKYVKKKLQDNIYQSVNFSEALMEKSVDHLVSHRITSLRKHQQLVESVLDQAANIALTQEGDAPVMVTEAMFREAEQEILRAETHRVGF